MSETAILFLLAYFVGLVLCLVKHPIFGLYTYLAAFYFHPPSRWWGDYLPELRWSLIAAVITLIASFRLSRVSNRPSWLASPVAKLLIAYLCYMLLQYFWALDKDEHIEGLTLFAKYIVLFYLIFRLMDSGKDVANFLFAHIAGCVYYGYLAFGATFSGGRLEGVGGPGIDDSNTMSMHLATGAICAAVFILGNRDWRRYASFAGMPLIMNTIILAGSRGSFLGLLAGGGAFAFLKPAAYRRLFWVFAALGVILLSILSHDLFWDRIGTIDDALNEPAEIDTSVESRLALFEAQIEMFKEHPFGAGHGGTAVQSAAHLDTRFLSKGARASHNTFMTVLVNQGIVGGILYSAIIFWVVATLLRLKRSLHRGQNDGMMLNVTAVGSSLAVVVIAGLFTNYFKAEVQIWMIALLATLELLARNEIAFPVTTVVEHNSSDADMPKKL